MHIMVTQPKTSILLSTIKAIGQIIELKLILQKYLTMRVTQTMHHYNYLQAASLMGHMLPMMYGS